MIWTQIVWGRNSAACFMFYYFAKLLGECFEFKVVHKQVKDESFYSPVCKETVVFSLVLLVLTWAAFRFLPSQIKFHGKKWTPFHHYDMADYDSIIRHNDQSCHVTCSRPKYWDVKMTVCLILIFFLFFTTQMGYFWSNQTRQALFLAQLCLTLIVTLVMCYDAKRQLLVHKLFICLILLISFSSLLMLKIQSVLRISLFLFYTFLPLLSCVVIHVFQRTPQVLFPSHF